MCFHWCSACGMLQTETEMGKEKRQKAFFSFFNSILSVRCFSVGVYSFISSVRLRPACQQCLHCCCWRCCSLAGLDPNDSVVLLLLPLSLAHSSPFSLSLSLTQVLLCVPPLFPSLTLFFVCFQYFLQSFFCPSRFQSFVPSLNSFFLFFPHLLGCLSSPLHHAARLCWRSSLQHLCVCLCM